MVLWAALGILGVAAQGAISFFRKPAWVSKSEALDKNWKRLAVYSTIVGLLFVLVDSLLVTFNNLPGFTITLVGVVGFLVFQSIFTDFTLRYVDRMVMRVATFGALAMSIYLLFTYGTELERVIFTVLAIFATATIYLPGVGDSDGRSFQIMIFTLYPVFGLNGIKSALVGMLLATLIYYIACSIRDRNWKLKQLLVKVSFPMVPLILTPVLLILLFGRWIPTF